MKTKMYVLSVGRSAGKSVIRCLDSVQTQTYLPTKHIVVDDLSVDNTRQNISDYADDKNILQIVFNKQRKYRLKNIYDNSVNKEDDDIIVLVDNDDWFHNKHALKTVIEKYKADTKLQLVYSRYIFSSGELGGSKKIPDVAPKEVWNPYLGPWQTVAFVYL